MRSLLAVSLVAACNGPDVVVGDLQEVAVLSSVQNHNLDILFVVDDSASMTDQQIALRNAFPKMIDVLAQIDGGLPNLHIGVVTSDMGTSSSTQVPAPAIGTLGQGGCQGRGDAGQLQRILPAMTANYLMDVRGPNATRARNYTGELRDVFGELAQVGATGCGFEQHLSAMKHAFVHPDNVAFLRPEANLAVVFVADEDDCSARTGAVFSPESSALGPLQSFRCFEHGVTCDEDPRQPGVKTNCVPRGDGIVDGIDSYIETLIATKGDPRRVMVAAIVGDPTPVEVQLATPPGGGSPQPMLSPSCVFSDFGSNDAADPAVRFEAFLDGFPGRATLTSICSTNLTNPLAVIGASAKKLLGDPCLDTSELADTSATPGVQPSCEVLEIRDAAPDEPSSLPPCSSGADNCYELVPDPVACPSTEDHLRIKLSRVTAPSQDTWTHVRCQRAD